MKKIEEHKYWWLGENHQWFEGEEVLFRLCFPRCMIRYKVCESYFASFEQWVNEVIEVQWLDGEKPSTKVQEEIILEGWNFLAIEERLLEDDMANIEIDEWEEDQME